MFQVTCKQTNQNFSLIAQNFLNLMSITHQKD